MDLGKDRDRVQLRKVMGTWYASLAFGLHVSGGPSPVGLGRTRREALESIRRQLNLLSRTGGLALVNLARHLERFARR